MRARSSSAGSSRQRSAVRRSCQTIAGATGLPRRPLPEDGRLALVRDPDRRELATADSGRAQSVLGGAEHGAPRAPRGRARPSRAAESAAGTRGSRGRSTAARRRRRDTSCPSFPGRSRGSRREQSLDAERARVRVPSRDRERRSPAEHVLRAQRPLACARVEHLRLHLEHAVARAARGGPAAITSSASEP